MPDKTSGPRESKFDLIEAREVFRERDPVIEDEWYDRLADEDIVEDIIDGIRAAGESAWTDPPANLTSATDDDLFIDSIGVNGGAHRQGLRKRKTVDWTSYQDQNIDFNQKLNGRCPDPEVDDDDQIDRDLIRSILEREVPSSQTDLQNQNAQLRKTLKELGEKLMALEGKNANLTANYTHVFEMYNTSEKNYQQLRSDSKSVGTFTYVSRLEMLRLQVKQLEEQRAKQSDDLDAVYWKDRATKLEKAIKRHYQVYKMGLFDSGGEQEKLWSILDKNNDQENSCESTSDQIEQEVRPSRTGYNGQKL